MDCVLASYPMALGLNHGSGTADVTELINHALPRYNKWTVPSLIVDRTHSVLANGKLVLQKASYFN